MLSRLCTADLLLKRKGTTIFYMHNMLQIPPFTTKKQQFYILIKEMNSTTICIKEYKSLIENSHL
jgi:hypothetical protein